MVDGRIDDTVADGLASGERVEGELILATMGQGKGGGREEGGGGG